MSVQLHEGDCLEVFRGVRGLGALTSDLPGGIGFMGRAWDRPPRGEGHRSSITPRSRVHERALQDRDAFVAYWAERLAVGYDACRDDAVALIWALPRTAGWTSRAMEDAGWRVVDVVSHLFGQGWPKSPRILKPAREDWIVGVKGHADLDVDACRIPRNWDERGEAWLRSGHSAKPGAAKITGAPPGNGINADPRGGRPANVVMSHAEGCVARGVRRIMGSHDSTGVWRGGGKLYGEKRQPQDGVGFTQQDGTETVPAYDCLAGCDCGASWLAPAGGAAGRCDACGGAGWWACPVAEVDAQSGDRPGFQGGILRRGATTGKGLGYGSSAQQEPVDLPGFSDSGGASRFFNRLGYYAKCPGGERHAGTEGLLWAADKTRPFGFRRVTREEWEALPGESGASAYGQDQRDGKPPRGQRASGNVHPTVKRIALMRWLHALAGAAPIGDLCAGSGSGAIAAHLDGIDWIGAEVCPEAIEIANARLAWWRGLSHEAARVFLATDVVPQPPPNADPRQAALFG